MNDYFNKKTIAKIVVSTSHELFIQFSHQPYINRYNCSLHCIDEETETLRG